MINYAYQPSTNSYDTQIFLQRPSSLI